MIVTLLPFEGCSARTVLAPFDAKEVTPVKFTHLTSLRGSLHVLFDPAGTQEYGLRSRRSAANLHKQ